MTASPYRPMLLRLDSSARTEGSHSRQLADQIEAHWRARHPDGRVQRRDLATEAPPHIDAQTIAGFYTPPEQLSPALRAATARSDASIAELKVATTLLIASPMYNFSVPSPLKAWIDQVVRAGHTFTLEGGRPRGLVERPSAVLALTYGLPGYGDQLATLDHLRPYLQSVLNFIGIRDIQVVSTEGTAADPAQLAGIPAAVKERIDSLFSEPVTT
ncbi:FMN-dependent NADH-azoreductase [Ottowia sp. GY511]|uniref:FMN dependent NADH:quinone oxidoreductase n=1 Tax=Ottowia flava TaxID=2675430 RepID=A0ABW4KN58_9BURK|nr:NAD(P)H-dependent oxidoreductase [Ottowia sp. GY511]TXK28347.1 FMN-dependent NADH-azoreductase [Ottowia sp. GY511]